MIKDSEFKSILELGKELGRRFKDAAFAGSRTHTFAGSRTYTFAGSRSSNLDSRAEYWIDDDGNVDGLLLGAIELESIPARLLAFKYLKTLICIGCNLSDISALSGLKNLIELDLSTNQLTDISPLSRLMNLKSLDLSFNQLSNISALSGLRNLLRLDLRENKIKKLPQSIIDLDIEIDLDEAPYRGYNISLYGNPLESPPPEIIRNGKKAIIAYFKSLEKGEHPLNEIKILLVGDGGAGKTSLVKRLRGLQFNENEAQTHGININRLDVQYDSTDIKAHLWDFGGQEVMHATHQFFLSERSLYILVIDGRKDEKTEYWLKHIQTFGGDSPVMIVLNKIDQNPSFEVNRRFLQEKYPNIKGFFRISCARGEGMKTFTKALYQAMHSVEIIRTSWANTWFNVKTRLEQMKKPFISYREYQEICREENVTDEAGRETLVGFLNDLGVIVHFRDLHLEDTHILEPRWVTEAVYKIINSPTLAGNKGILPVHQLRNILKQEKETDFIYPSHKYSYIIELMKKFELCFEIDKSIVLVPDLLEVEEPLFEFDYAGSLKFLLDYEFLPRSVIPRFIVRMHAGICGECCRWRTGVLLEDKILKARAVVKADNEEKRIFIYVAGEQKRDYFAVIRHTLWSINSSFEKLDAVEKVPLTENNKITVEYRELRALKAMGELHYAVGKLNRKFSIVELLNGIEIEGNLNAPPRTERHVRINGNVEHLTLVHAEGSNPSVNVANINQRDSQIEELIKLLILHNLREKEELISQLRDENVKKNKGKLGTVLGKVLTNGAEIAAITSTVSSLLGG